MINKCFLTDDDNEWRLLDNNEIGIGIDIGQQLQITTDYDSLIMNYDLTMTTVMGAKKIPKQGHLDKRLHINMVWLNGCSYMLCAQRFQSRFLDNSMAQSMAKVVQVSRFWDRYKNLSKPELFKDLKENTLIIQPAIIQQKPKGQNICQLVRFQFLENELSYNTVQNMLYMAHGPCSMRLRHVCLKYCSSSEHTVSFGFQTCP